MNSLPLSFLLQSVDSTVNSLSECSLLTEPLNFSADNPLSEFSFSDPMNFSNDSLFFTPCLTGSISTFDVFFIDSIHAFNMSPIPGSTAFFEIPVNNQPYIFASQFSTLPPHEMTRLTRKRIIRDRIRARYFAKFQSPY
ncbi:hypothetical protein DSO57_1016684 [Entomophthora muscae]|uniref:Uncharacterized protein n=1 Tax=Entomophthora muscae TaxID=34485 RepID=A0ACC2UPL4_9FUNG|nr:hypothetical protein DSO57_1016684 [Entomophthora muscae]